MNLNQQSSYLGPDISAAFCQPPFFRGIGGLRSSKSWAMSPFFTRQNKLAGPCMHHEHIYIYIHIQFISTLYYVVKTYRYSSIYNCITCICIYIYTYPVSLVPSIICELLQSTLPGTIEFWSSPTAKTARGITRCS